MGVALEGFFGPSLGPAGGRRDEVKEDQDPLLGPSWDAVGALLGQSWGFLGALSGLSWGPWRASWGHLGGH
eukprot:7621859-Pyramimonas_sp.AAC.1